MIFPVRRAFRWFPSGAPGDAGFGKQPVASAQIIQFLKEFWVVAFDQLIKKSRFRPVALVTHSPCRVRE